MSGDRENASWGARWQRAGSRVGFFLRLWRWVPVLWLLACAFSLTPNVRFEAPYAAVALAVHLGVVYGRAALGAVAVGVLPQLLALSPTQSCFVGGHLDVAVLALLGCAMASSARPWRDRIERLELTPRHYALLALLPLIVAGPGRGVVSLNVDFSFAFYLCLFAAGLARTPPRPIFFLLLAATTLGLVFTARGHAGHVFEWTPAAPTSGPLGDVVPLPWLTMMYDLNSPAALLAGLLYYATGRIYRRMLDEKALATRRWWSAILPTLGVILFAVGWGVSYAALKKLPGTDAASRWQFLGDYHALPLAALLAGLLLKRPGVALAALLAILFWFLNPALGRPADSLQEWLEGLGALRGRMNLGDLVVVIAFGALGLHLRRAVVGEEPAVRVSRWLVLAAATVALVHKWTGPADLDSPGPLLPLLYWSAAALGVMAGFAWWWRRRFGAGGRWHAGWIALLALAGLLQVLWGNLGAVREKAHEIAGVGLVSWLLHNEPGVVPFLLFVVALYLWGVLTAARTFFKDVREWCGDVLRGARVLTKLARRRAWTAKLEALAPAKLAEGELAPPHTWQPRVVAVLDCTRYTVLTLGIVGAIAGLILLLREWQD